MLSAIVTYRVFLEGNPNSVDSTKRRWRSVLLYNVAGRADAYPQIRVLPFQVSGGQVFIFDLLAVWVMVGDRGTALYELNTTALFTMSPHVATIAKQFSRTIAVERSF
jgi:hypothetical protein